MSESGGRVRVAGGEWWLVKMGEWMRVVVRDEKGKTTTTTTMMLKKWRKEKVDVSWKKIEKVENDDDEEDGGG